MWSPQGGSENASPSESNGYKSEVNENEYGRVLRTEGRVGQKAGPL